jgi:hypothetical protein
MVAELPSHGRLALGQWVLANVVAFTAAGALGGTLLRSLQQPYYAVVKSTGRAVLIDTWTVGLACTIFGAFVGAAQWWVIRKQSAARWWLPATVLGWVLTGLGTGVLSGVAGGSVSTIGPASVPLGVFIVAVGAGVLVGLPPGTFQWLVLRRHVEWATWWPGLSLLGLAAGFAAGFVVVRLGLVDVVRVFRDTDFPSGKVLTLVGAVAGAGYAVVTGPALARSLGRQQGEGAGEVASGQDADRPAGGRRPGPA